MPLPTEQLGRIRGLADGLAAGRDLSDAERSELEACLRLLVDQQITARKDRTTRALDHMVADKDLIAKMGRAGLKVFEIAGSLGMSKGTVWEILKEAGLT